LVFRYFLRFLRVAAALAILAPGQSSFAADGIEQLLQQTHWGESSNELLHQFGAEAMQLRPAFDFGDTYADVVLQGQTLGGVPIIAFFQMDKATTGLKRIQLERPRHGVNPPAYRAVVAALHAAYGKPDEICEVPVSPDGGYQAAGEELWRHGDQVITAIFRDTTLQAFEGCLFGLTAGPCGLTGQLLVRIEPANGNAAPDPCSLELHRGRPNAAGP
jgi:hypothetical protein